MKNNEKLKELLEDAHGIAWDTCHKIYILMDDKQMEQMRGYEYDPLLSSTDLTPKQMYTKVRKWYLGSCGLRFIDACFTEGEDTRFLTVVGQWDRFYNTYQEEN